MTILTNARLVLPDAVVMGTVVLDGARIVDVQPGRSHAAGAVDLGGDTLMPGVVDVHTDNLERHYQPRKGVEWDAVSAAISHDVQIAGSGITTVYDSLTLGAASGWDMRAETVAPIVEGLRTAVTHDMLRIQHLLHMRCEVTHPEIVPTFEAHAADPLVRFMSLMDHAPRDRQSPDVADYRRRYLKMFDGDEAADRIAAARAAAPTGTFVLNARTDAYFTGTTENPFAATVDRAIRYVEAGADCIFVPGVDDPETIRRLAAEIPAPLNIVAGLAATVIDAPTLLSLGVRRVMR